jgi:cyclopropane fatty-acyl-phospholipid synthase-like methyltransferase
MKLYDQVERIHNELAALDIGDGEPLSIEQLAPFDQYHYFGTAAVDEAIAALAISPEMRLLDIGSGIGGPARHVAARTGARVTALELQPDLDAVARGLTRRCGLDHLVDHRCGNILDGLDGGYDAIISFLCFLHIPQRARLFEVCRASLKPGGRIYIEDFARHRAPTGEEADMLALKVQCPAIPEPAEYARDLREAGFPDVRMRDVTDEWRPFTETRLAQFRAARDRNVAVHGVAIVEGLDDFYATVAGLFGSGLIAGLKILAG